MAKLKPGHKHQWPQPPACPMAYPNLLTRFSTFPQENLVKNNSLFKYIVISHAMEMTRQGDLKDISQNKYRHLQSNINYSYHSCNDYTIGLGSHLSSEREFTKILHHIVNHFSTKYVTENSSQRQIDFRLSQNLTPIFFKLADFP